MKTKKKLLIFGCGKTYKCKKQYMDDKYEVMAFIDNNKKLQGGFLDEKPIISPSQIMHYTYDEIAIAAMDKDAIEFQLRELGISSECIVSYDSIFSGIVKKNYKREVLIVVHTVNTSGGFVAPLNAGRCLVEAGYKVVMATPYVDNREAEKEVLSYGIDLWTIPSLPYIGEAEIALLKRFDYVIFNTIRYLESAFVVNQYVNSSLWLHDPSVSYKNIKRLKSSAYDNYPSIYAVSKVAANVFENKTGIQVSGIMPYGLHEFRKKREVNKQNKKIFAMVGHIGPIKNQLELVEAIKMLSDDERSNCEFWFIGRVFDEGYFNKFIKEIQGVKNIKYKGEMSHELLEEEFERIDVVVCSSVEDMLPVNIVEGLMNRKICIVSSVTGMTDFIEDKVSAFVYNQGEIAELIDIIIYVADNYDELGIMRDKAREIYDKYFSFEIFLEKLKLVIDN